MLASCNFAAVSFTPVLWELALWQRVPVAVSWAVSESLNGQCTCKKQKGQLALPSCNLKLKLKLAFRFLQPLFQLVDLVFHALRQVVTEFREVLPDERHFRQPAVHINV